MYCNNRGCRSCFHVLCGRLNHCVFGWNEEKDAPLVLCEKHGKKTFAAAFCEICGRSDKEESLLLCDGCDKGFHLFCLKPPLKRILCDRGLRVEIPAGDWYCPACLEKRVRQGEAVVVSKRSGEEQGELSRDYVGNLIKNAEKKAKKRRANGRRNGETEKGETEEEEEEEDEEDEGVSFYESKRSKTIVEDEDEAAFQLDDSQSLDLSVSLLSAIDSRNASSCSFSSLQSTSSAEKSSDSASSSSTERGNPRFPLLCLIIQMLGGFSVVLTGLGSKYTVLKEFQRTALRRELCIVINGFNPSFSFSELLSLIATRFLSLHSDGLRQDLLVNRGTAR